MSSLAPKTKLQEVINDFGAPGLKDLRLFSELGKKKVIAKKAMENLEAKDICAANAGLGIIYTYENELALGLQCFKRAYEFSHHEFGATMNYAHSLFINGYYPEANKIYLEAVKKNPTDKNLFHRVFKTFEENLYLDELIKLIEISQVGKELTEDQQKDLVACEYTVQFLNRNHINIEIFRELRAALDSVFYKYYTLPTESTFNRYIDETRQTYSYICFLPINLKLFPQLINLVGDLNDELQDKIINIYDSRNINSTSNPDKINFYFSIEDISERDNTNAA